MSLQDVSRNSLISTDLKAVFTTEYGTGTLEFDGEEMKTTAYHRRDMNLFIRNYVMSPQLDANGKPIGGLTGFMRSLQKKSAEQSLTES